MDRTSRSTCRAASTRPTPSVGSRGGYLPNRTPDGADTVKSIGGTSLNHPVFLDPSIERSPDPRAYWSISDAIKFLLAEYNGSQTYTSYPALDALDTLLQVESPPSDQGTFDPGSAETSPLTIRDYDASNQPYPEAIADLLSYAGFVMRWDTGADGSDFPSTQLRIYRRNGAATAPLKSVYLDAAGTPTLDPSRNNVVRAPPGSGRQQHRQRLASRDSAEAGRGQRHPGPAVPTRLERRAVLEPQAILPLVMERGHNRDDPSQVPMVRGG